VAAAAAAGAAAAADLFRGERPSAPTRCALDLCVSYNWSIAPRNAEKEPSATSAARGLTGSHLLGFIFVPADSRFEVDTLSSWNKLVDLLPQQLCSVRAGDERGAGVFRDGRRIDSPSRLIPTEMHFFRRQYWQRLRLIRWMAHCWFLVHGRYWIFCWMLRRKNPCNESNNQMESVRTMRHSSATPTQGNAPDTPLHVARYITGRLKIMCGTSDSQNKNSRFRRPVKRGRSFVSSNVTTFFFWGFSSS